MSFLYELQLFLKVNVRIYRVVRGRYRANIARKSCETRSWGTTFHLLAITRADVTRPPITLKIEI